MWVSQAMMMPHCSSSIAGDVLYHSLLPVFFTHLYKLSKNKKAKFVEKSTIFFLSSVILFYLRYTFNHIVLYLQSLVVVSCRVIDYSCASVYAICE